MMVRLISARRGIAFALLAALVFFSSGCGGREFAEVEGTVKVNGEPVADIEVQFLPEVDKGNTGNTASAYTDEHGHYKIRSERDSKDGTVLGPHRVLLLDTRALPDPTGPAPPPSRLPDEYSDHTKTPLRDVEVKPGKQTFDFDVPKPKAKK